MEILTVALYDNKGMLVPGKYSMSNCKLFAKEEGAVIVHDPRLIWKIQSTVKKFGGRAVQSKTGHIYFSMQCTETMQYMEVRHPLIIIFAIFTLRCGMMPWLLILEYISQRREHLSEFYQKFKQPSSGIELSSNESDAKLPM